MRDERYVTVQQVAAWTGRTISSLRLDPRYDKQRDALCLPNKLVEHLSHQYVYTHRAVLPEVKPVLKKSPFAVAAIVAAWVIGLGGFAYGNFAWINGVVKWEDGIYAGHHYGGAKNAVLQRMVTKYGTDLVRDLRYRGEIKTHILGNFGGDQMRIFYFTGPKGLVYCSSIWKHDGTNVDISTSKTSDHCKLPSFSSS